MIIGIVLFLLFLFIPYFIRMEVPFWFSTNTAPAYRLISLLCGFLVTFLQLFNLFMVLIRRSPRWQKLYKWYYSLGNVKYESHIKKAGLFKVDEMLSNALKLHVESLKLGCSCEKSKSKRIRAQKLNNYGRALFEYSKLDGIQTTIGGIGYAWKRLWTKKLLTEDGKCARNGTSLCGVVLWSNLSFLFRLGIWISNRLALGTVFQVGVCCATPVVARFGLRYAVAEVIKNQGAEASISKAL